MKYSDSVQQCDAFLYRLVWCSGYSLSKCVFLSHAQMKQLRKVMSEIWLCGDRSKNVIMILFIEFWLIAVPLNTYVFVHIGLTGVQTPCYIVHFRSSYATLQYKQLVKSLFFVLGHPLNFVVSFILIKLQLMQHSTQSMCMSKRYLMSIEDDVSRTW